MQPTAVAAAGAAVAAAAVLRIALVLALALALALMMVLVLVLVLALALLLVLVVSAVSLALGHALGRGIASSRSMFGDSGAATQAVPLCGAHCSTSGCRAAAATAAADWGCAAAVPLLCCSHVGSGLGRARVAVEAAPSMMPTRSESPGRSFRTCVGAGGPARFTRR